MNSVTNAQLCLTIGIPTLTVIFTSWSLHRQVQAMCDKIVRQCDIIRAEGAKYTSLGRKPQVTP
jgi:hypothetical protein